MNVRESFALWPIVPFGGEDGDDGAGDAGDGASGASSAGGANGQGSQGNSGKGGTGAPAGTGGTETTDDDDGDDDEDELKGLTPAELRRIASDNAKAAKEAEKQRKAAQKIIDDAERKKNDENTNLKKDLEAEQKKTARIESVMTRQAILGAIRDDRRFEWHDPEMVAQQLDPEVVKVDENGKVSGLKNALPKVAKDHPFLLAKDNTNADGKNGKGNGNNGSGGQGPSGFQPSQGGSSTGGGDEIDTKVMVDHYPALASRV